ncbi:beta-lactamase hydrolase domain-containing protein, partial [Rhizobium johnstonii]|uniref:beta-lactamase hydrolase domain-containing protein n=1 Tax=Rhizobium johnstonii TaxID=3019933 RepID=UPI003F94DEBE
ARLPRLLAIRPGNTAEKASAAAAGLSYSFVPVKGAEITEADIFAFQATMAQAKGPVVAHCKSGTRALTLHALGEVLDG